MIRNIEEVRQGHSRVIASTERALGETMGFAGTAAMNHVRSYPEFRPHTGNLQAKTGYRVVKLGSGKVLKIFNSAKQAHAIDGGARAHIIRPRRGKFLRFMNRSGRIVFARVVHHPGNRPFKFLYNATDAAYRLLGQYMRGEMTSISKRF